MQEMLPNLLRQITINMIPKPNKDIKQNYI